MSPKRTRQVGSIAEDAHCLREEAKRYSDLLVEWGDGDRDAEEVLDQLDRVLFGLKSIRRRIDETEGEGGSQHCPERVEGYLESTRKLLLREKYAYEKLSNEIINSYLTRMENTTLWG